MKALTVASLAAALAVLSACPEKDANKAGHMGSKPMPAAPATVPANPEAAAPSAPGTGMPTAPAPGAGGDQAKKPGSGW